MEFLKESPQEFLHKYICTAVCEEISDRTSQKTLQAFQKKILYEFLIQLTRSPK